MRGCVGPRGETYPSLRAAAKSLGVPESSLRYHLRVHGNLQRLACGVSVPVTDGADRSWPSQRAAALELGVEVKTVAAHLELYGHLGHIGCKEARRLSMGRGRVRPLVVGPVRFPSRKEAAAEMGVSLATLSRWTSRKATPSERALMLETVMVVAQKREAAARAEAARELARQRWRDRVLSSRPGEERAAA